MPISYDFSKLFPDTFPYMLDYIERFDMKEPVRKQRLRLLMWALALPETYAHKLKIHYHGDVKKLKPPYFLLANHNAFLDMKNLIRATLPKPCNYVIAIDGFIGREGLLRTIGGICTRKFVFDVNLILQMQESIRKKHICVLYPEARYSLCGTEAVIPSSVAKLAKLLNVPLVTLVCHGDHINSPFWNTRSRKIKGIEADMQILATPDELKAMPVEELQQKIDDALWYDDYAWQKEKGVKVTVPWRAEGLHKVLYQCPHCGTEYRMSSKGSTLTCEACGKSWEMSELGELKAKEGNTEFAHIPNWYEWERANVRKEIEEGKYRFESVVHVEALPNADRYIPIGKATLIHDMEGFHLSGNYQGEDYKYEWQAKNLYSCHIEYEYLGTKGDCVDLNLPNDTFYIYPECELFSVTKLSLATEELHKYVLKKEQEAEKTQQVVPESAPEAINA